MAAHKTRAGSTRTSETRAAEARPPMLDDEGGILDVPPDLIPPGMVYGWVRMTTRGEPDPNNTTRKARRGWKPVPADRLGHDILQAPSLFGNTGESRPTTIQYGGLILCEMPKRDFARVQDRRRQHANAALEAVAEFVIDAGVPLINESSRVTHTLEREFKE